MNLDDKIFLNKGLYDNKTIYENTIEAIKNTLKIHHGLYLTVRETKDKILIVFEDSNLSRLHNLKDKLTDITYEELNYLSFYHIPTLEETLKVINGKQDIVLNLKMKYKNKELFNLLDNYSGKFVLLSHSPKLIRFVNKEKSNYIIGEMITKRKSFLIDSLFIKTNFKSYDINYYDVIKFKKMKENNNIEFGYLINTRDKYLEFKDMFNYLIIDNYNNLQIKKDD